jgi:bifunctional DNA-binding transcriptional regulator/antitoxin component of YhaV-PrlF toxin-antitoxin module
MIPSKTTTAVLGKHGMVQLPEEVLKALGACEGDSLDVHVRGSTVVVLPRGDQVGETYTDERKAEFLLSNAVDAADYAAARDEVRKMGLDADSIPHLRPPGT